MHWRWTPLLEKDAQLHGREALKQGPTLSSFLLSLREALLKQGLSLEAAALWCSALAYSCFQFEDTYLAEHGHMPLSPASQDMEGPSGSA